MDPAARQGRAMGNLSLYILTVLIWGSTWFAIEFQLGTVAVEASIAYRYLIASASLFAWLLLRGERLRYPLQAHFWFALMGVLMFCLNYLMAYRAQIYLPSALSAIVFSSVVWMNILNARLFFGVRAGWRVLLGSVIGVAGLLLLFLPEVGALSVGDTIVIGALLAALGAFSASLGNMVSQRTQARALPVLQSNAWGMLYGALATIAYALMNDVAFTIDWSAAYIVSLLYLALFGSVIAFWSYLTLLGRIGAHRAGYVSVLFPVVALIISMLFEGLQLSLTLVVGAGLVLAGNVLVLNMRRRRASLAENAK